MPGLIVIKPVDSGRKPDLCSSHAKSQLRPTFRLPARLSAAALTAIGEPASADRFCSIRYTYAAIHCSAEIELQKKWPGQSLQLSVQPRQLLPSMVCFMLVHDSMFAYNCLFAL